jgi:hypothetical protein
VAEYYYKTTSTSSDANGGTQMSTTTHHMTVVVAGLTGGHLPVELRGRAFGKLGLAMAPGQPTGVAEFDRRYKVHADSRAPLSTQVIEATVSRGLPAWQVRGGQLIIPWPGRLQSDSLDSRVGDAVALAALLDSSSTGA